MSLYFHPFMVGGVEWYVYNISRELVKLGHEVEVVTAQSYDGRTAPPTEEVDGIKVKRVKLSLDWSYRMKMWDGLSEVLESGGYDVIHAYDYAATHSLIALRAARRAKVHSALTVFDIHRMIPRKRYKKWAMKIIESYFASRTLPASESIMVRAPELIPPLIKMGAEESRIRVTPSGIRDESLRAYDGNRFRQNHEIGGSPMLLFLGRLNALKGPRVLIEAAPMIVSAFPDCSIVLVGPDQVGYRSSLEQRAAELGVAANVHFTGPIYELEEKMQAYSACDVFVMPTTYEGTSQAIFEAMAQGKPVVASRVGGIPSQIEDGVDGVLVEFGDAEALGKAILRLLGDRSLMASMGASARRKAPSYCYSKLARTMDGLYRETMRN